jgi:hypothetical protein
MHGAIPPPHYAFMVRCSVNKKKKHRDNGRIQYEHISELKVSFRLLWSIGVR